MKKSLIIIFCIFALTHISCTNLQKQIVFQTDPIILKTEGWHVVQYELKDISQDAILEIQNYIKPNAAWYGSTSINGKPLEAETRSQAQRIYSPNSDGTVSAFYHSGNSIQYKRQEDAIVFREEFLEENDPLEQQFSIEPDISMEDAYEVASQLIEKMEFLQDYSLLYWNKAVSIGKDEIVTSIGWDFIFTRTIDGINSVNTDGWNQWINQSAPKNYGAWQEKCWIYVDEHGLFRIRIDNLGAQKTNSKEVTLINSETIKQTIIKELEMRYLSNPKYRIKVINIVLRRAMLNDEENEDGGISTPCWEIRYTVDDDQMNEVLYLNAVTGDYIEPGMNKEAYDICFNS